MTIALEQVDLTVPKPRLANEKPKGQTIAYDKLLESWTKAR